MVCRVYFVPLFFFFSVFLIPSKREFSHFLHEFESYTENFANQTIEPTEIVLTRLWLSFSSLSLLLALEGACESVRVHTPSVHAIKHNKQNGIE